jgi:type VI secretion system secreted protein VgrG
MPDGSDGSDAGIQIAFSPDPGYVLQFRGYHIADELGHPFLITIELSCNEIKDAKDLIGSKATLTMKTSEEGAQKSYLNGVVTKVVSKGIQSGSAHYEVELRPWIWLLSRVADCLIFQNMSAFDIITKVFRDAGFSDFEDKRQSSSGDITLDYCVQYRETSFNFVMRLMEQFGIYYFFKHEDGKHTLVFADDPNSHETLSDAIPFGADKAGPQTVADHITEWHVANALDSAKFTFRDYNFETPAADMTAKSIQSPGHTYGSFEVYDYPGPYDKQADGTKLTDVRIQAIGKNRNVMQFSSNARGLRPGWRFTLKDHPLSAANRDYLITKVEFTQSSDENSAGSDGKTTDTYQAKLFAIPGDVNFRLERKTPRPMIRGPQTALVDGESGEEITTDKYGRVKVKFYWDRGDAQDNQHTCWIRVAQSSAGTGWGHIFIPRKGQEVVVEFLEGNPDRPLITGVVYNANVTVPYSLPDNKTQSGIKTSSSQGNNGNNEFRFEDKAGSEEVFFQAQKDFTKKVLNNETVTIHKDTVTTVETGDRKVTVSQGGDTLTVSSGNHKLEVSAGQSEYSAAQSIEIKVGGNSLKIDTTSMTLTVGANTVKLDPSGVAVNGTQVQLQGSAQVSISAPMVGIN